MKIAILLITLALASQANAALWKRTFMLASGCTESTDTLFSTQFLPDQTCLPTGPGNATKFDCGLKTNYTYPTTDCSGTGVKGTDLVGNCAKGPVDGLQLAWKDECGFTGFTLTGQDYYKAGIIRKYDSGDCTGTPKKEEGFNAGECKSGITYMCGNRTDDASGTLYFVITEHFNTGRNCNITTLVSQNFMLANKCVGRLGYGSAYIECSDHPYVPPKPNAAPLTATLSLVGALFAALLALF